MVTPMDEDFQIIDSAESLEQAADAASTALRHAEEEGARGLACFGQPVIVAELDIQEEIRKLAQRMDELKVKIAEQEDAQKGVDLLGLVTPAVGSEGDLAAAPGADGPAAGEALDAPMATTSSPTTSMAAAAAGGAGSLPAAPGALGPAAGEVASTAAALPAAPGSVDLLAMEAEPPMTWPVSAEPRPAASQPAPAEEDSERPGLGFLPPAPAGYFVESHDAMADVVAPSTPPAHAQAPAPPRPSKRPLSRPMEEPTAKVPTLPGFTKAAEPAASTLPMPIRFTPAADPPGHVRFDMFPDSFPAIPGHLARLLAPCSEKEMVQLFDQFTGYPLTTPMVTKIIEQYIPLRALAKYQKTTDKSGLTDQRGLHRPAGEVPFHSMCGNCFTPWPEKAARCWTCKHDQAIEYQRPTSIMEVGDTDQVMWSITCGSKHHPFPDPMLEELRQILHPGHNNTPPDGQPFYLDLISQLAHTAGDPDWQHSTGVPLGVSTPTLHSPGVWPLKSELAGEDPVEAPLDEPRGRHNYPSAADFSREIRATFEEEVPMGMTVGPLSRQEAATLCGCEPSELCPGPLAGIDEGDKVRTIYDGSVGGANAKIQQNTKERTTAPTVLDCVHAIHWLHAARNTTAAARPKPSPGAFGPEQAREDSDRPPTWEWPTEDSHWILLKADVTKAHRRIKVLPQDWRFQVAQLEDEWWVNKVGTYGMASAQLYWGRLAALLLQIPG